LSACVARAAHARELPRIQIPGCNNQHISECTSQQHTQVAACEHTAGTGHCMQTAHSSQRLPHPLANLSVHGSKQLSHDTSSRTHTLTDLAFNLRKAPKLEDARNTGQRSHAAILFRSVATQSSIRDPADSAAQQMRYTRSGQLPSHGDVPTSGWKDDAVRTTPRVQSVTRSDKV
jgi:hypothetical protein